MPEKYLYNNQLLERKDIEEAAGQSKLDVNSYLQKAGIQVVNDNYKYNGKIMSAADVLEAANESKIGFSDYVQKAGIQAIPDEVKKKEVSLADGAGTFQNGVQSDNGLSNGLDLSAGTQVAGSTDSEVASTGIMSSILPKPKIDPLQKIADLAKKQHQEGMASTDLSLVILPRNQNDDLINKNISLVEMADPNAISDVVGKELEKINVQKQKLQIEKSEIQKSLNKDFSGRFGRSDQTPGQIELDQKINQYREEAAAVVKDGVQALKKVYGDKFTSSPDKSSAVQDAMGAELRSHYAKIGADVSLSDQQGVAAKVLDLEDVVNSPQYKNFPIKTVMEERLRVAKKTKEELEYENRGTILSAAQQHLSDQYDAATTPEEQAKIKDEYLNLKGQQDNLINQYPQVKQEQQQQLVSELWAQHIRQAEKGELGFVEKMKNSRDFFEGRKLNDPDEIKAISELSQKTSLPMTEDEVKAVADQARVPSTVGRFLRGFGDSFTDLQQGVHRLTDSKANADIANKTLEETKYHTPGAFTKNNNLPNILGNMFGGAGNMTGLAVQMWVAGELVGGVTGLTKLGQTAKAGIEALSEADVAALGTASQVVPSSKMAKWMVDLGAADSEGEALGTMLKAATKAKHIGGTVAAIGIPTYEAAYQQASQYTDDEEKRNAYASQSAVANILGMLALNPQAIVGKGLSGVSKEQVMQNFLESGVPYGTKDVIKARLAEIMKPIVGVVPAVGIPLAQEAISKENLFGIHTSGSEIWNEFLSRSGNMALSVLPFGAISAARIPTSAMAKASIYEVGLKPEKSISNVEDSYTKGDITEAEKNRQISLINTTQNLVSTIPDTNNTGKKLSQADKNDLVYQQLQHASLLKNKENATEALKPSYDKALEETQAKINNLMGLQPEEKPQQKPEPTLTEKRLATEAASKYKANISAIEERTDINDAEKEKLKSTEDERHAKELQSLQSPPPTIQSAVIEIGGKTYEGKNHAEAILAAQADGQDISQVDRSAEGKFKLSNGEIIDRAQAKAQFVADRSEQLIPQDDASKQADKNYQDANLLTTLHELSGEGLKGQDMQFFVDQASNAPDQFNKEYGVDVTKELLAKATIEQLKKSREDAAKFEDNPNVPILDEIIKQREYTPTKEAEREKVELNPKLPEGYVMPEKADQSNTVSPQDAAAGAKGPAIITPSEVKKVQDTPIIPLKKAEDGTNQQTGTEVKPEQQPGGQAGGDTGATDQTGQAAEVKIGDKFQFNGQEWEVTEDNGETVKATNGEVQTSFPKESVASNIIPPREPPVDGAATPEQAEEQWTAVKKERLKEIEGAKEVFEKETSTTWPEILQSGLENLQDMYPDKDLYEAAKQRAFEIASLYDVSKPYNPTAQDISVLRWFRRETEKKMSEIEGWDSPNDLARQMATLRFRDYQNDLLNTVKALNTREAGTAFGIRASEERVDPQYELQIRRLQMLEANNGEKLSEETLNKTAELWEQEKELMQKEHQAREASIKEEFEKRFEDLQKQYKQNAKSNRPVKVDETAKKKTLTQSGKEAADRIRKGKIGGTQAVIFPGIKQGVNFAIETIAQIVEKGATVADAISQFIKDHVEKGKEKEFQNAFWAHINDSNKKEDSLEAIKNMAAEKGATSISYDMVVKNHVRDFVDSFLADTEPKDVLDKAAQELKQVLPDVTPEQLREAYLKNGDYVVPPKEKLESDLAAGKKELKNIVKLQQDVSDLNAMRDLRKGEPGTKRERSAAEQELINQKNEIINKRKAEKQQFEKEYRDLEKERNRQASEINKLTDKIEKLKAGIKVNVGKLSGKEDTPEITELRKQLEELDKEFRASENEQRKLDREAANKKKKLDELDEDIKNVTEQGELLKRSVGKSDTKLDKDIEAKQKELQDALVEQGEKLGREDKYTKASYITRAKLHNQRLEEISQKIQDQIDKGDLSPEEESALKTLKGKIDASTILLSDKSALSQAPVLDHGLTVLKEVLNEFDKTDKSESGKDFKRLMQRAIDKFGKDKDESEQDMKLNRVKERLKSDNRERERKINAGEFEDKPPVILKKSDAELIKLQIQRDRIESLFNYEKKKLENKTRSFAKKTIDFLRSLYVTALIYKFGTLTKVAVTSLLRPNIEAITKTIGGNIFKLISPSISERAKAGGESSSLESIKKMYEAYFMQNSAKGLQRMYDKANEAYENATQEYEQYSKQENKDPKKLQDLKNKMDNALVEATGNLLYQYIGGSSMADAFSALMHRSNKIEREFGYMEKEGYKDLKDFASLKDENVVDKVKYVLEFIGRSHSAIKTFAGRANFAAGFIARVEDAVKNGEDVSNPDKILQIANESYLDWDRGKYQQKNAITDAFNAMAKAPGEKFKGTEFEKYGNAISTLFKFDLPITRVPVNILHEAVMEYTLGGFRAIYKTEQVYREAKKEAKQEGHSPNTPEFESAVKDYISKLDKDQAAMIVRSFRKGGFGIGLFALFTIGGILQYGGFHHFGEKKKAKKGELLPGEIEIAGVKMPKILGKVIEHTPGLFPALLGANAAHTYNEKIEKGKTDLGAALAAAMANLQAIQDQIPQTKLINPIGITTDAVKSVGRQLGITQPKK